MNIFRMFSFKSVASGALILGINQLLIIKPLNLRFKCYIVFKIS